MLQEQAKTKAKILSFFSLHDIKIEQNVIIFDNQCIINNAFHKNKRPISIDKVDMKGIVLYEKDSCGKKGSFKCFTYYINETDLFQYHYA